MRTIKGKFIQGRPIANGTCTHFIKVKTVTKEDRYTMIDLADAKEVEVRIPDKGAEVLPVESSIVSNVREILVRAIDEIDRNSGTNASAGTEKLAEMPMSSQQANIGHDPDATGFTRGGEAAAYKEDLPSSESKESGPGVPLPMGVVEGEKHEAD